MASAQLPTVILFRGAKEVCRVPAVADAATGRVVPCAMDDASLISALGLKLPPVITGRKNVS